MTIEIAGRTFTFSRTMLALLAVLDGAMTLGVGYAAYEVGKAVCG